MKRFTTMIVAVFVATLFGSMAVFAGSGGGNAPAVGKVNVPLTVPKVSKSDCKLVSAGAHVQTSFDVSKTTMVNWKAMTSSSDPTEIAVKRFLNTNTDFMPRKGEDNLPIDAGVSSLKFSNFTAASPSATTYICVDMN